MTKSKLRIVYIVILLIIVAVEITTLITDPTNIKLLAKGASLILVYVLTITGIYYRNSSLAAKHYESQYRDIIGNAFINDRASRNKLLKAITVYNQNSYDTAVKLFDSLKKKCTCPADYSAILLFRARCFSERKLYGEAIATYEELLKYDGENSRAWSNLGLCYANSGRTDLAENAYRNAIRTNDKNAYAYTNLASLLLDKDEAAEALKCAETALQINATLQQAISTACLACTSLGDERAHEYFDRYVRNGGDQVELVSAMVAYEKV